MQPMKLIFVWLASRYIWNILDGYRTELIILNRFQNLHAKPCLWSLTLLLSWTYEDQRHPLDLHVLCDSAGNSSVLEGNTSLSYRALQFFQEMRIPDRNEEMHLLRAANWEKMILSQKWCLQVPVRSLSGFSLYNANNFVSPPRHHPVIRSVSERVLRRMLHSRIYLLMLSSSWWPFYERIKWPSGRVSVLISVSPQWHFSLWLPGCDHRLFSSSYFNQP